MHEFFLLYFLFLFVLNIVYEKLAVRMRLPLKSFFRRR